MATSNTKLEDIILQAVDIVASQKIAKAGYDKTIQATIVSCIDATIGKYKVKYQDSYWIAYSNNIDNSYAPNTSVYVLIPGGNMSKDKTILGTTKHLGVNYITVAEGDQRYTPVGANIINNETTWNLCSYKTETKVLYSVNFTNQQNLLTIDNNAVKEYIQNSTSIIAGAHIKNNLNVEQRFQGNYGILFGLDFKDRATNKVVTRYYSIDVDTMKGNPYYYPNEIRQYNIFEIDGENFEKVNIIAIFTKDFPVQKDNMPDDIFISKLELGGAISLEQQDLDTCTLVLLTPKGYIFTEEHANNDTRTIEAQVRVKGKIIDTKSQKVDFYWFVENLSVTAASPKYNKYGGQGWECLNSYQTIRPATTNGSVTTPAVLQFIPGSNIFSIKKSNILAKTTKYKCVAIYDNTVLSKETKIIRYDSEYEIYIESSRGTQFYNSAGTTTLTCQCKQNNNNVDINSLNFVWAVVNNTGNFNSLPTTVEYNEDRSKLITIRDAIDDYINKAEYFLYQMIYSVSSLLPSDSTINSITNATQKTQVTNARAKLINAGLSTTSSITAILNKYNVETSNLTYKLVLDGDENHTNSLKAVINNYNGIQRVSANKVTGVQISSITNFSIFKCSVFTKVGNTFLGSGSITLSNSPDGNRYSLVINNGSQVYKYNTQGVSPANKQNDNPQAIPALSFSIYDNQGQEVDISGIDTGKIVWTIPNSNTLLKTTGYTGGVVDSTLQTISFKNLTSFSYSIAESYNANYTRNDIELKVEYNGSTLVAKTNLSFLKQGANGTNGTDFVCKIVPNVLSGSAPVNPTIYYNGSSVSFNWNTDTSNNRWFKAQLWHNGELIFESTEPGNSTEGKFVTVVGWEILRNTYAYNKKDSTNLNAVAASSNANWSFSFTPGSFSSSYSSTAYPVWRPANIVKVTLSYDGVTYYATLPVVICRIFNNNYFVQLKDYSGFREVVYSSSGQSPKYDTHAPFEILTFYKTGNNWEDISNKKTSAYQLGYEWYYLGSVWNKNNTTWNEDAETTNLTTGESSKKWLLKSNIVSNLSANQKAVKPADTYSGECVNTAMACRVYLSSSNATLAWIHIPIHMMRNRFENSAINGWDGNSVNLGGENGGMILAPQVGAGIKSSNNSFTGVFIGTSKDPSQNSSNVNNEDVGLFGYHEGSRSIFLDAKTGKAVFGEQQKAQIVFDPTNGTAKIQSGNYQTGSSAGGLLIDLTTPEIKFGTGNFNVDKDGKITAKGGGSIAGWEINNTAIFNKTTATGVNRNSTGMNSNPVVDSTSTSINGVGNGSEYRAVSMPPTTSSEGSTGYKVVGKAAAFWAGSSKFFVTHDGYLRAQQASIGSGSAPIFIGKSGNQSAIFSGLKASKTANSSGFYLGTDGIGIGTTGTVTIGNSSQTVSNFQVDKDGKFFARNGYISGTINATDGQIAKWNIKENSLQTGAYNSTGTMYFGTSGLSIGTNFVVDSIGNLTCINSQISSYYEDVNSYINEINLGKGSMKFYRSSGSTKSLTGQIKTLIWGGSYGNAPVLSVIGYDKTIDGVEMLFKDSSNNTVGRFSIYNQTIAANVHHNKNCVMTGGLHLGEGLYSNDSITVASGGIAVNGGITVNDGDVTVNSGNLTLGQTLVNEIKYSGINVLSIAHLQLGIGTWVSGGYTAEFFGSIYVTGQVKQGSDEKIKNIINNDDLLDDFILSLEPIKYTWKNKDIDQKIHYGLGAQTTLKKMQQYNINCDLVEHFKENDSYGVAYSELAPMMLVTVQKNRKKIEALEQQIAILKDMIKDIKGDKK